jgi:hypothetical protein
VPLLKLRLLESQERERRTHTDQHPQEIRGFPSLKRRNVPAAFRGKP